MDAYEQLWANGGLPAEARGSGEAHLRPFGATVGDLRLNRERRVVEAAGVEQLIARR